MYIYIYIYIYSLSLPPRGPACSLARSFIAQSDFLKFMSVLAFVAVRWLQNRIYSNETVALLAPETQL